VIIFKKISFERGLRELPFFLVVILISCGQSKRIEEIDSIRQNILTLENHLEGHKFHLDSIQILSDSCFEREQTVGQLRDQLNELNELKNGIEKFLSLSSSLEDEAYAIGLEDYKHRINVAENALYYLELEMNKLDSCIRLMPEAER